MKVSKVIYPLKTPIQHYKPLQRPSFAIRLVYDRIFDPLLAITFVILAYMFYAR